MREITMASSPTKSNRPSYGTVAAPVNASAAPSANTKVGKSGVSSSGGMLAAATANHRAGLLEPQGARWGIRETLYAANAAAASDTERNVRTVPSAIGNRDFWDARQRSQV